MLLLVLLAAIGLGPGGAGSLGPLPKPPRFEAAVGDGAAVGRGPALAVGTAHVAPAGQGVASAERVGVPAGGGTEPALAVTGARAVQVAPASPIATLPQAPEPVAPESVESQPVAAAPQTSEPHSSPATSPVVAGVGTPSGPVAAGIVPSGEPEEAEEPGGADEVEEPETICEGVEYTVTVAFDVEAIFSGSEDAEILLHRAGSDGSEIELQAQGGIEDLNALLEQFASEGDCVTVEVEPLAEASPAGPAEPLPDAAPAESAESPAP